MLCGMKNKYSIKHITLVRLNSERKWVFTEGISQKKQY